MPNNAITRISILVFLAALLAGAMSAQAGGISWRYEVKYTGDWQIQPNGDIKAVRTFTIPAMMYTNWKASNLHMREMRNFHPSVSTVKVDDLDYKWDDVKRTLTLTMTVRGLAVNKGDHWEALMAPGVEFSNIDAGQKKAYFMASMAGAQTTVVGQDIVTFPSVASDIRSSDARTLCYKMPAEASSGGGAIWWILFGISLAGGLALLGVSFIGGKSGSSGGAAPQ